MISDCISNDIPTQMNILNMVIHILMYFCACLPLKSLIRLKIGVLQSACHPMKCDVFNDIKLFPTVYCSKFFTISNQQWRYKSKCIRMVHLPRQKYKARQN